MRISTVRRLALATLGVAAALPTSGAVAAPGTVTALGTGASANTLARFTIGAPTALSSVPVTGLAAGETVVGIDDRPADGLLYALAVNGNDAHVYTLDPLTGAATSVAPPFTMSTIAGATAWDVDFNPVADRLRVVNDLASGVGSNINNFRVSPAGTLASAASGDTDLDFTALPGGGASAPLAAVAYDRNTVGASATLFGIASGADRLVRLGGVDGSPSPNSGVLADVGPLGVDTSSVAGLDIAADTGVAYAALEVGGASRLYRVNLTTGAAVPTADDNRIGNGTFAVADIALAARVPSLAFATAAPTVGEGLTATITVTRTGPLTQGSTVAYTTEHTATTTASGSDFTPTAGRLTFAPGEATQTFAVPTTADTATDGTETIGLRLSDPTDATLAADGASALLSILDPGGVPLPPLPTPGAGRPPLGLIGARTQKIDRTIAATFSCNEACDAVLKLKLGRRILATVKTSLPQTSRKDVTFKLSLANMRRVRAAAKGAKSAKLTIVGTFSDGDGKAAASTAFVLP